MNYRKCRYNNYVCLSCVLSVSHKNEELSTFEKSTKSCEAKLKGKDAGNYSLNADNTEAKIEVKREETNIDFLDGIDRYFTEKAAEIDKECHIRYI
jgi:hypothetical protein